MTSYSKIFELHKHLSLNIRTILLFWPFHIEHDEMADHEDCHLFPITAPVNYRDVAHSWVLFDDLNIALLQHSHCHAIFGRIKTNNHSSNSNVTGNYISSVFYRNISLKFPEGNCYFDAWSGIDDSAMIKIFNFVRNLSFNTMNVNYLKMPYRLYQQHLPLSN